MDGQWWLNIAILIPHWTFCSRELIKICPKLLHHWWTVTPFYKCTGLRCQDSFIVRTFIYSQWRLWWRLCRDAHAHLTPLYAGLQIRVCTGKLFFLFLNQNICCGYSKEPSQWDASFEHPKHMFKLIGKEINAILGAQTILIWTHIYAVIITSADQPQISLASLPSIFGFTLNFHCLFVSFLLLILFIGQFLFLRNWWSTVGEIIWKNKGTKIHSLIY